MADTINQAKVKRLDTQDTYKIGKYTIDMSKPSCECFDWSTTNYPCKHMFAVMKHHESSLPEHYLSNPWFCLDDEIFDYAREQQNKTDVLETDQSQELIDELETDQSQELIAETCSSPVPLVGRKRSRDSLAAELREQLRELTNITYLITDTNTLQNTNEQIKTILQSCKGQAAKVENILLEKPKKKSRKLKSTKLSNNCLPKRKVKGKYSGRVGSKAEFQREQISVAKQPTAATTRAYTILQKAKHCAKKSKPIDLECSDKLISQKIHEIGSKKVFFPNNPIFYLSIFETCKHSKF